MLRRSVPAGLSMGLALLLSGCLADGEEGAPGPAGPPGPPGPPGEPAASWTLSLSLLGRYESGQFGEGAAEVVAFHPATARTFVVNAASGRVDVLDATSPQAPRHVATLDVAGDVAAALGVGREAFGAANSVSVAVAGDLVAVALEANPRQNPGQVALYRTDGTFLRALPAGPLPDMLTFTPDGRRLLVANEGEPTTDGSFDPEGSITLVDLSDGVAAAQVHHLDFRAFGPEDLTGPVRISPRATSVAADLEPEYIAVAPDGRTAYAILQENSAVAVLDLERPEIQAVVALAPADYSLPGHELDASDRDGGARLLNWPLLGARMPDAAAAFAVGGRLYLVTANEGDAREFLAPAADAAACEAAGGIDFADGDCLFYRDEIRLGALLNRGARLAPSLLERLPADFAAPERLGRLKVVTDLGLAGECPSLARGGQPGPDCTYGQLYTFGSRSFTIWDAVSWQPVADSGADFERITAARLGEHFNADADDNEGDGRSDDKGPEPEALAVGVVEGRRYAFIGLERSGGIFVYDITQPQAPHFVEYFTTRDFRYDPTESPQLAGDLAPEHIAFVAAEDSPTGRALLIVGHEVSGTTAFIDLQVVPAQ
ncbi:MAG: alkaline phosphatase [Porticoccaceae bacterium]|nr:MAG: alkaline phosphatase [Porticoccaceae bacterium]